MRFGFIMFCCWVLGASTLPATELVRLSEKNWDEYVIQGKEADAIYGDFVLRNNHIMAVIAAPTATRNANMTVRNVGWAIIDLTQRSKPNDQLSAFYPDSLRHAFTSDKTVSYQVDGGDGQPFDARQSVQGRAVTVTCTADPVVGRPEVSVRYTLTDGDPYVLIETTYKNSTDNPYREELSDTIRADGPTFQIGVDASTNSFFADDEWFRQTYGLVCPGFSVESQGDRGAVIRYKKADVTQITVERGENTFARKLFPAANLLDSRGLAANLSGTEVNQTKILVRDARGPVRRALLEVNQNTRKVGTGRTDDDGTIAFLIPAGEYQVNVSGLGRPQRTVTLALRGDSEQTLELEPTGNVVARITDDKGHPTPCKVSFTGVDGTADPDFGPTTAVPVKNVFYSHDGRFSQEIPPGKYQTIISYGPEYDAVFRDIDVRAGSDTNLEAQLVRSVDTTGWVSADFHSHSSPSGDNTCDQRARVLNLLCEHIEFAPCTEHNRIDTYVPHLEALKVTNLMATCSGMELTGQPLPLNHQNGFPLKRSPRTQDGGAPVTDENPIVQIRRLAMWDHASEKLVQINHPNLTQMIGDRDEDGNADGGFAEMFQFADVIEVHPLQSILVRPDTDEFKALRRNAIFVWMQMLNLGYRPLGVVNTDAHYSFHESGGLRNYVRCTTDDPAKIDTAEMVNSATRGNLVMSNGPFMTVEASAEGKSAMPGDNLVLSKGELQLHVRVQCPNWLDVNHVLVFVNGRPDEQLNFSRQSGGDHFSDGVVKFDAQIPVKLSSDAHVLVCAAGEGLTVGPVMGPHWGKQLPIAVANPIFVDVDSNGFHASGDQLDSPLPIEKTTLPTR